MYEYQNSAIADLAAQLKRGSKRLSIRLLTSIEFLLSVLEPDRAYPFDFILHALTGFRARNENGGGSKISIEKNPRADLVTLAEDLSAAADIPRHCIPDAVYTVTELARRFDVSTKTIFRWHRRGLAGWRLRFSDHRQRLTFPERCIRRFVAQNADLVQRGSTFSQLTAAEREKIITRARVLADAGQKTVNAVARVIAGETDRAVETIRLILKSYDEAHPKTGVFNRSNLKVDANDERLKIWEAYSDGSSIEALKQRFGRSVGEIYRVITEMRARALKARLIEFIASPEFADPGVEDEILNGLAAKHPTNGPTPTRHIPADLPPYLQQLFHIALLTPTGERALFRKFNYLKYRADRARKEMDPNTATARDLDRIDALLAEAQRVKGQIVQANLRLVVSIAKRHTSPYRDFFEIVSDGNMSLMRAVEKFDYSRGFKFSTYASWAIMKNFARTIPDYKIHLERYQTGRDELLDTVSGPLPEEHESDYLPTLRTTLDRMMETLDEREQSILRQRFGIDEQREPQTLQQVGERFGISKERIRQLEARAMDKLRENFADEVAHILV
jgi:RNA polymerase primary sigma factor